MTECEIAKRVRALQLPDIMAEDKDTLFDLYDQILKDLDVCDQKDAESLHGIVMDWFQDILSKFFANAQRELKKHSSMICDDITAVAVTADTNGRHITSVPCLIADWVGFIGYISKKYGLRA